MLDHRRHRSAFGQSLLKLLVCKHDVPQLGGDVVFCRCPFLAHGWANGYWGSWNVSPEKGFGSAGAQAQQVAVAVSNTSEQLQRPERTEIVHRFLQVLVEFRIALSSSFEGLVKQDLFRWSNLPRRSRSRKGLELVMDDLE